MQQLTDEERKQLCVRLRRLDLERDVGVKAADEIERLAKRVAELEALLPDNARWAIQDNSWMFRFR
jgi:BMFP domain-containing protein YqiC